MELQDGEYEVFYLSGPLGNAESPIALAKHEAPWPLSFKDLRQDVNPQKVSFSGARILLGKAFDTVFRALAGGESVGKYSWVLPGFTRGLRLMLKCKPDTILSMGGPTSAHVVSLMLASVFRRNLIVELQDPLIGNEMHFSAFAGTVLRLIEKRLVRRASKFAVTSFGYLTELRGRYPHATNIHLVYPLGAEKSIPSSLAENRTNMEAVRILHLGSLYGTRSLDNLFLALEHFDTGQGNPQIQITNMGNITLELEKRYAGRKSFVSLPFLDRESALIAASGFDALLVVQHLDSRSLHTVPYKVFDYLNLGLPIISLSKTDEISRIVTLRGGRVFDAKTDNVASIQTAVMGLVNFKLEDLESKRIRPVNPPAGRILFQIKSCSPELCDCKPLDQLTYN